MENTFVNHVSDAALWIAMYRAQETEKPDAVFKDHLASSLAGERGKKIVDSTPHSKAMAFAMVVRTAAIDSLIQKALDKGVDTIINLGAGLDTRPYRMKLPASLRWVEVDYPSVVYYKNEKLKSEKPSCKLDRIAADLTNDRERKKLFVELGTGSRRALVITEGVIGYLTNEEAMHLSKNIYTIPSFKYWIQDYSQGWMRKNRHSDDVSKTLKAAPWKFDVFDPISFFSDHGWKVMENKYILDEAKRIGRKLPPMFPWNFLMTLFPNLIYRLANKTYGYVLFGKEEKQN